MPGTLNLVGFLRSSSIGILRQFRQQRLSKYLLVFFVAACGYPERPKVISVSNLETFRPSSPREIKTVEQALAAIITVCRDDLKFPPVQTFEANLYKNSQSFASYGVDWRMFPTDVSNVAAFANGKKIHVDLGKVNDDTGWATFTWLLAHEFGHTIHHEVSGVIPLTDPWFNEGFAEWIAAKVFDALGWQDYRYSISKVTNESARHLDILPHLPTLRDRKAWNRILTGNYGMLRTYSLGLLAVDRLLQRKNLTSAIPLLSANTFNEALGGSYDEFDQDLRSQLSGQQTQSNAFEIVHSPRWNVGDRWTHELRRPGYIGVAEREFVRTDSFAGIPSYVVKSGDEESYFSTEALSLAARKQRGEYTYRVSNMDRIISWPLQPNKEWLSSFTYEDAEVGAARSVKVLMRVVGVENVAVKAGQLRAVKIEAYGYSSGRLSGEFWYSPESKWFARTRINYRDFGLVEQELVSFKFR